MNKRLTSLVVVIAMLFLVCNASAASPSEKTEGIPLPTDHDRTYYVTQWASIEAYHRLLDSFSADTSTYAHSDDAVNTSQYPDYFGGAYLDDLGQLVILTTDISVSTTNKMRSATSDNVIILPCSVSLNEMFDTMDRLSSCCDWLNEQGIKVSSFRDDILSGKVIVSVFDLTDEKEMAIQNVVSCNYLEFENADVNCKENAATTIKAGENVYRIGADDYHSSTVGFAATCNGLNGFVTTGHTFPKYNDKVYYGNNLSIGAVWKVSFHNNMTADASFILTDSPTAAVSQVVNGYRIASATTQEVPINTPVYMYGVASKLTSGKFISYRIGGELDISGYKFDEFAVASYPSQDGDSGAPVLIYNGASNYSLLGIHSASASMSYFTPYKNIVEALGVTLVPYYS